MGATRRQYAAYSPEEQEAFIHGASKAVKDASEIRTPLGGLPVGRVSGRLNISNEREQMMKEMFGDQWEEFFGRMQTEYGIKQTILSLRHCPDLTMNS